MSQISDTTHVSQSKRTRHMDKWVMCPHMIYDNSFPRKITRAITHTKSLFVCVTWPIHMCNMTYSHVWHDPLIWITRAITHTKNHVLCENAWLICMCERAHILAYIFACILAYESELTYKWVMRPHTTHIPMRDVTDTNESRHTYEWVMSHIRMSHVTHTNESRQICLNSHI